MNPYYTEAENLAEVFYGVRSKIYELRTWIISEV